MSSHAEEVKEWFYYAQPSGEAKGEPQGGTTNVLNSCASQEEPSCTPLCQNCHAKHLTCRTLASRDMQQKSGTVAERWIALTAQRVIMCHIYWVCAARVGPVTKVEIQQAFSRANISLETAFWTVGMMQAQPLWSIRELRWLVSGRAGALSLTSHTVWNLCSVIKTSHGPYPGASTGGCRVAWWFCMMRLQNRWLRRWECSLPDREDLPGHPALPGQAAAGVRPGGPPPAAAAAGPPTDRVRRSAPAHCPGMLPTPEPNPRAPPSGLQFTGCQESRHSSSETRDWKRINWRCGDK